MALSRQLGRRVSQLLLSSGRIPILPIRRQQKAAAAVWESSRFISAVGSWSEPAHYVGEHFGNVAGRLLSVLCLWRGRLSHAVPPRRGGIWRRFRDVQLLYCARLEPLGFSGYVRGTKEQQLMSALVHRLNEIPTGELLVGLSECASPRSPSFSPGTRVTRSL